MNAQTLHCPDCGAAASSEATKCEHCGARLATVACPSCFGMIFLGAKFCAHCGARVWRLEEESEAGQPCPRCRIPLQAVTLGTMHVRECQKCEGLWVGVETFNAICADRERQAAVLGGASPLPEPARLELTLDEVRYLPCPDCQTLMNRVNFAGRSGVIIDACRGHGTWFDRDELRHIVEFIRAGGLEQAREEERKRLLEVKRHRVPAGSVEPTVPSSDWPRDWFLGDILVTIAELAARFLLK